MSELREMFEMTVKQMGEPALDSWREQERRQRKASRNKKLGAIAVAAVLVIAAVVVGITALGGDDPQPTPLRPEPTTPPELAEQTLSIVDVGSGSTTPFTAPAYASHFDFTRDGSMVAYSDLDQDGNVQVFVMDADGSNVRQLTHGEESVRPPGDLLGSVAHGSLHWSPDSSMIAYQAYTADGLSQIFTVRVSDGVSTRVTSEPWGAIDPGGWTPDGGSLVFSTPNLSTYQYSARSVDLGTGRTELIMPDASDPELSPDGAWITFNSWLSPDYFLQPNIRYVLANSDGSGRRVIAPFVGDDAHEEWSPDSTQIAFVADIDENGFGTHVYDLVTGKTRFVSSGTIETWIDNDHILVS